MMFRFLPKPARSFMLPRMVVGFFALFLIFSVGRAYLQSRFPYTHDGSNHLARFANYAAAVRQFQLPPRFAPSVLSGYGFPVFNYNYPLANILAVPWATVGVNPEVIYRLEIFMALGIGLAATYLLLRLRFPRLASWFGSAVFITSSYLLNALWFRGDVGEIWAYVLVPVVAFCTLQAEKKSWRWQIFHILSLVALLLSHNLLGVLGAGVLGVWSLLRAVENKNFKIPWFTPWLIALGLTLWFWLPMLLELPLIVLSSDALAKEAVQHTLTLSQLLFSPLRFGFSLPGPIDSLGYGVGVVSILVVIAGLSAGIKNRSKKMVSLPIIWLVVMGVLSVFLSLDWSLSIWNSFSLLNLFQFPWRWLWLSSLLVVPLAAWVFQKSPRWLKIVFLLLVVARIFMIFYLQAVDQFHYEKEYYLTFPGSTLTRNEDRPKTLTKETFDNWQPGPQIVSGDGSTSVQKWTGSDHRAEITAQTDLLIKEDTVYFPGWETRINGQKIEQVFAPETEGLIAYKLPAREQPYDVHTKFIENTPARLVGDAASLFTLLIFLALIIWQYRKKNL